MELCCVRLAGGENLSDEVTVECRPARIKRERREKRELCSSEVPEGVFRGEGRASAGPDV